MGCHPAAVVEDVEDSEEDSEVTRLFVEDVEGVVEPRTDAHQRRARLPNEKTMGLNWQNGSSKCV